MKYAFSSEEAEVIKTTHVTTYSISDFDINLGNDTDDQVFLLSMNEAEQYFENDEARRCAPTKYAAEQEVWITDEYTIGGSGTCWWWLRSPDDNGGVGACVCNDGSVYCLGTNVNFDECVRPALRTKGRIGPRKRIYLDMSP